MKLKKVAALCAKIGAFHLFDEVREDGEFIRQWLGDGNLGRCSERKKPTGKEWRRENALYWRNKRCWFPYVPAWCPKIKCEG